MGIRTQFSNKRKQVKTVWGLQSILSQGKSENQACIRLTTIFFIIYIPIPFYSHVKYYLSFYIKINIIIPFTVSHTIPSKSTHTLSSLINHQINLTNHFSITNNSLYTS